MRRQSDLAWFSSNYKNSIFTVRIIASEETRKNRGWKFTIGKITKISHLSTELVVKSNSNLIHKFFEYLYFHIQITLIKSVIFCE